MSRVRVSALALFICLSVVVRLCGQPQVSSSRPKVAPASVRPSPAGRDMISARAGGDRITLENYPLREMIGAAYGVRSSELLGGPPWIASTRYDIVAKAEKAASNRELWTMAQSVLEERFQLRLHHEKREFPVFNLSFARYGKLPASREGSCVESDPTLPWIRTAPGEPLLPRCGSTLYGPGKPTVCCYRVQEYRWNNLRGG